MGRLRSGMEPLQGSRKVPDLPPDLEAAILEALKRLHARLDEAQARLDGKPNPEARPEPRAPERRGYVGMPGAFQVRDDDRF